MAGAYSGFDAAAFRTAIQFVADMAAPATGADAATFYFPTVVTNTVAVDGEGTPFDPRATVTRTTKTPVTGVHCLFRYTDGAGNEIVFGDISSATLAITFLDVDYQKIKGCNAVEVGQERWIYKRTEVPKALFDAGIYILHFVAENET